jgi:hypothetical protein
MLGDLGNTKLLAPAIKGAKYRATYLASVKGILGPQTPRVSSRGSLFYNHDRWTLRHFVKYMVDWAQKNAGCVPLFKDVADWTQKANNEKVSNSEREIVVANTPEFLPLRTALALTGGAYHEALHTLRSCRRDLKADEMFKMVVPRWAKVADWSRYTGALLEWSNLIEDIRIERLGCQEFEIHTKLCDLQDFILNMEEESQQNLRAHKKKPGALNIISTTFRDVGLGYPTQNQKIALDRYRKDDAAAVKLVLDGPLTPFLKEAIALKKSDDTACLRISLDVIATLGELAKQDEEKEQGKDGQPGDGKQKCPQCGASAGKLKVRPKSDGKGGKVKNKGIVTCTVCGWQQEIDIELKKNAPQPKQGLDPADEESPEFEGFEPSDFEEAGDGSGKGQKSKDKGQKSKGKSAKGEDSDKNDKEEDSESGKSKKGEDKTDKMGEDKTGNSG